MGIETETEAIHVPAAPRTLSPLKYTDKIKRLLFGKGVESNRASWAGSNDGNTLDSYTRHIV